MAKLRRVNLSLRPPALGPASPLMLRRMRQLDLRAFFAVALKRASVNWSGRR